MPNTEQPIDLETQVMLMKKYVNFRQRKKMREFLGDAGFYLDKQYYTPTKSEKDKKTRNRNVLFFHTKFFVGLKNDEEKLRRDVVKHSELKEYRKGGTRQNNVLPVSGSFDLILMDIQMPNMDGYKATQTIRHLADHNKACIPIVAMTANAFEEDRKKALDKGMNGHIAKPIDIDKVKAVLFSVLK